MYTNGVDDKLLIKFTHFRWRLELKTILIAIGRHKHDVQRLTKTSLNPIHEFMGSPIGFPNTITYITITQTKLGMQLQKLLALYIYLRFYSSASKFLLDKTHSHDQDDFWAHILQNHQLGITNASNIVENNPNLFQEES